MWRVTYSSAAAICSFLIRESSRCRRRKLAVPKAKIKTTAGHSQHPCLLTYPVQAGKGVWWAVLCLLVVLALFVCVSAVMRIVEQGQCGKRKQ